MGSYARVPACNRRILTTNIRWAPVATNSRLPRSAKQKKERFENHSPLEMIISQTSSHNSPFTNLVVDHNYLVPTYLFG
jgi:hypothetical protein